MEWPKDFFLTRHPSKMQHIHINLTFGDHFSIDFFRNLLQFYGNETLSDVKHMWTVENGYKDFANNEEKYPQPGVGQYETTTFVQL